MQQHQEVISAWLGGAASVDGMDNPAGPLYLDNADMALKNAGNIGWDTGVTTASCIAMGCHCC